MSTGIPLRLNLTLPCTTLNLGFASVDPLALILGGSVEQHLGALMAAPRTQRKRQDGRVEDVYPLSLPDGQAFYLTLGSMELGIGNANGHLQLVVPILAEPFLFEQLRSSLVSLPERVMSIDQRQLLSRFLVRLMPGARASLLIERIGEVGIEAG